MVLKLPIGTFMGLRDAQVARQKRADRLEELRANAKKELRLAKQSKLELALRYGAKEKPKEIAKAARRLKVLGFDDDASIYLARSGEGEEILRRYDKLVDNKKLSKDWIPSLQEEVKKVLGEKGSPQAIAQATLAALNSDADMSTEEGQEQSLIEAIYAATDLETLDKLDIKLLNQARTNEDVSVPPIGPSLNLASPYSGRQPLAAEIQQIRGMVIESIGPTLGVVRVKQDDGTFTINYNKLKELKGEGGAAEVEELINNTVQNIISDTYVQPGQTGLDLIESINNNIDIAKVNAEQLVKGPTEVIKDGANNEEEPASTIVEEERKKAEEANMGLR